MREKKIIFLLLVILSGCMMTGVPAINGSLDDRHRGTTFVKEVKTEGITVVLEVPLLTAKKQAMLLVRVWDDSTGEFISNAEVFASIQEEQRLPEVEAKPRVKKQFQENAGEKAYQLIFQFGAVGWYEIEVKIRYGNKEHPPKTISIRKMVAVSKNPEKGLRTEYFILAGGAGMLVTMGLVMGGVLF